MHATQI